MPTNLPEPEPQTLQWPLRTWAAVVVLAIPGWCTVYVAYELITCLTR